MTTPFQVDEDFRNRLTEAQAVARQAMNAALCLSVGYDTAGDMHRHLQRLQQLLLPIIEVLTPITEISELIACKAPEHWQNSADGALGSEWAERAVMALRLCRNCLKVSPKETRADRVLSVTQVFVEAMPTLPANLVALEAEKAAAFEAAAQQLRAAGRLGDQFGTA